MKAAQLPTLRLIALLFLLSGLGGLILSAIVSTHYLDILPRGPAPEQLRITPRSIHGVVVYQTSQEDRRLTILEDGSVCLFLLGLGLSVWYIEKWSELRGPETDDEDGLNENYG